MMKIFRILLVFILLLGQADLSLLHAQVISPIAPLSTPTSLALPVVNYFIDDVITLQQPPAITGGAVPTTQYTYNTFGQPTQVVDPNGNVTQMTYFATAPFMGYLQSVAKDPAGINAVTQLAYDAYGNVIQITDPNARATRFAYNQLGWLMTTTNPLGRITKYTYDANGNVLLEQRQSDAAATLFQTTTYTYDLLNHVKTVKDPLNQITTLVYDANDNLITKVDPVPNTTSYLYDERNLLFKTTDANPGVTQYDYDRNGQLSAVTDAKGNKTTYLYDGFNRKIRTTYSDTTVLERYAYDKNSNVIQEITPNNQVINYVYDGLNRLTNQTYADTTMNVARAYDVGSRLTRVVNGFSDTRYAYDRLDRVLTDQQIFGTLNFIVRSAYDKAGNRISVTYPSGKIAGYTYNALNQVTAVSVNGVALANYAFDPLNRLTTKNLLGGPAKSAVFGYDAANQLLSLENKTTAVISKHTYLYDKAGNRLRHDNQAGTAAVKTLNFAYNKIYELTTVTGAQAHTYAYDKVGNRTIADSVAYASNTLNQYTTVGAVALTYDKNGNMTGQGTTTYIYDAENRLLQLTKGTTVAGKYRYDAFNRRISKEIGTAKTFFVHDGDMVIEERNAAGAILADYVNGPGIDEVLTMTRAAVTSYYFYDGLGSVRQITNAAGAAIETYDYDVFGKPLAASTKGNPVMFTGRWFDIESGNYYYRARYYSPGLGRFMQRDPLGYVDGMNQYTYVGNNSTNYVDPDGEFGQLALLGLGLLGTYLADQYIYEPYVEPVINNFVEQHIPCAIQASARAAKNGLDLTRMLKNPVKAVRNLMHKHHTIPRAVLKKLPEPVRKQVSGKKGSPNIMDLDAAKHRDIHKSTGKHFPGGDYNKRFDDLIKRRGGYDQVDQGDVLKIRDQVKQEFDL